MSTVTGLSPGSAIAGGGRASVITAGPASIGAASATTTPPPGITSLNPVSAVAGGAAFTLTINGTNFASTSSSMWGATALKTTYVSAAKLTAAVPASLIATAGTASVTVSTVAGASSGAAFTITQPPPAITSLSPASAIAGRAFTMTINGRNFAPLATAKWGAAPLTTTFVSATQLTAAVPASLVAAGGRALVTVSTAGGTSPAAALAVSQPMPTITSLSPNSVMAGGQALTLTVNGANYASGAGAAVVRWNYTALTTTYVSCNQITAVVPASLISGAGTAAITVVTAGGTSSGVPFTINPAPPAITSLSPGWLPAGFGAFVLYVSGTHFSSAATVNWGSTSLVTAPEGGSILTAKVPASLVASVGTASVTVTTAGGTSAPVTFTIMQPPPIVTSLSPSSAAAGGANLTLTVNGTNFTSNSEVWFASTHLATTYISATQLKAAVYASLIAIAGTRSVVVLTLGGVGISTSIAFTINPASPTITSFSPASVTAGGAGFMLTIKGTAFTPATTSMWGTTPLGTVYVSPTQLIAAVPASLIVDSGTGSVTVTTQAGTSAPAAFAIKPAAPAISGLSPGVATAGGTAFTLTINGEYFTAASTAKWGSTALTTAYINEAQLTAAVPAKLIANAGSASITVNTTAGTSAPAAFTVYPAPKITTTTLPSGTAGSAYSGAIKVTGGVPGYTWSVMGLPDSMSFLNTSGSTLTIAGTPAEPGTVNFQVSVQDTGGATAGPVPFTLNVAGGPSDANDASLNGSYVCLFQGFIDDDGTRWASLASFQADGKGHFSTGVFDTNSHDIGSASGTITGSYSIGSDNNGLASLHTILTDGAAGIQTTKWAIALASASQPAQQFRMVEADDLGELPSGEQGTADCNLATTSAFAASTISGSSFAFGLEGEDRGGNLKAAAGLFSASAGKISSGSIDLAQGGNGTVQTVAFTGSYTTPDPASGRFKIALKAGGNPSGLTVYIIDANRMFILDNTSNDGEEAGNMRTQQPTSYSAANISGPFVLYMRGAEFNSGGNNPSGYYADVFQGTGDGDGNMTINQSYTDDNGAYSAGNSNGGPMALAFDSAHSGRATFQSASGTTYLYLFNTNSAFEMSVGDSGAVDSGWLEPQTLPQTQTAFTDGALAGNYLFGELPLLNGESNGSVGEFDLTGSGTINGAVTTSGQNNLSWDQASSMTYAWDATAPGTGTFLVANGTSGGASCAVINSTKFVCASQTYPSPSVEVIEQ
jgi:hypothetical protein